MVFPIRRGRIAVLKAGQLRVS